MSLSQHERPHHYIQLTNSHVVKAHLRSFLLSWHTLRYHFSNSPPLSHTRPREGVGDVRYICTWYFLPQTNPSSPAWELTIYRVRTSLEPRGMDKMITASKDVINKMDVLHSHYTPPFFLSFTLFPLPLSLKWFDRKWNRGTILVAFCYELVLFFGFKFGLDFDLCMI